MRKVVLGMLLAAGAMLPGIAAAQDEGHRPDNPRKWADQRTDLPVEGAGRGERGPAAQIRNEPQAQQQARPAAPAQAQPQAQAQAGGRFGGDRGPRGDGNRDGQRQFGGGDRAQAFNRDGGGNGYRGPQGGPGQRFDDGRGGDRFVGRSPVAPGSGGYRPQGGYDRGPGFAGGPGYRPGQPQQGRGGTWNRGWRGDNRYDWGGYRAQNRSAFHLPRYYAPRGWGYGYRRFSPGFTLQSVLFSEDYWIDDVYDYRLPPAYGPYRWVRYYNDALLVDIRSGYVVDTVYDIFW